ncbi:MAG: S41 family peptidase, partial [Mucilaginibacter sp.]
MMKLKTTLLFALSVITFNSFSQPSLTSDSAYNRAQQARNDARKLWRKHNATNSDFDEAIKILNNAVVYLDSLPVRELAQGNLFLNARKQDVYADMVRAYATEKKYDRLLDALEKRCNEGAYYGIDELEKDSLYAPLRKNPRFLAMIGVLKNRRGRWKDESLKTAFKPNLSAEEKTAGLSLLWSQAKYNFVHFDHAAIDWDKTYLDYLGKIKDTQSTKDYYRVLQQFYAQLKDGHTNVYFPDELSKEVNSRPPLRSELIEDRVFITKVFSDSLQKAGVTAGLEILKIDGVPVITYAKENVEPYQSSSTPQDLEVRDFSYGLFSGPEKKPVTLLLKNKQGKTFTKSLARTGYRDIKYEADLQYSEINNTGYLVVNNFEDEKIMKQFDSLYTSIDKTKGLIIDIRNNGGGDSYIGYHIIAALTNKRFKSSASRIPRYISIPGIGSQWTDNAAGDIEP